MPMFPGAIVVPNFDFAARTGSVCIQLSSPLNATNWSINAWSIVNHSPGAASWPISLRMASSTSFFDVIGLPVGRPENHQRIRGDRSQPLRTNENGIQVHFRETVAEQPRKLGHERKTSRESLDVARMPAPHAIEERSPAQFGDHFPRRLDVEGRDA